MSNPSHALYVANTSLQTHVLMFALEHQGKVYEQTVAIGDQVKILNRDLTEAELGYFIKKKEKYGFRNVRDIGLQKEFVGICYSVDAPVNLKFIKGNFERNNDVLNNKMEERLEDSTTSIATLLREKVAPAPVPLRRSSVELQEETQGEAVPRISVGREYAAPGVEPSNHGKSSKRR